jgi:hypothetical protein
LYLFNAASGTFSAGTNISSSNLAALGLSVGDVDGDGDIDLVVALENGNNLYFENNGFRVGTTAMTHGDPALVTIHVEAIYNWSFEKAGDHYGGWTMTETYANDPELPVGPMPEYGTFAIIANQPGGTTINWGDVLYDYYDGNDQMQFSFHTLSWVPGMPGITIDGSETAHTAVILSGLDQKDASLYQIVDIPQDIYLDGLEFQWDISYWNVNPNSSQPGGYEFGPEQFVAVYLYDISSGTPEPVWVTTNGQDSAVVGSMAHHEVELAAGSDLVQAINSGDVQLMVEIRVCGIDWYLDAAIDDFTLVPSRHYPAFQVNPVAAVSMPTVSVDPPSGALPIVTEDSLVASSSDTSPPVSGYSLVDSPAGASPPVSGYSLAGSSSESVTPFVTFDSTESVAGLQASPLSLGIPGELWMSGGFDSEESSLSVPLPDVASDEDSGNEQFFEAQRPPSSANANASGIQGSDGATDGNAVAAQWSGVDAAAQDQVSPEDVPTGSEIAADVPDVDGGAGGTVLDSSLSFQAVEGIVFNLDEIDAWQVINAAPLTSAIALSSADRMTLALKSWSGGSFSVRIDSLNVIDLFA